MLRGGGEMAEVTPGALCLVIKGYATGASVTAVEIVDIKTAEAEQMNIAKRLVRITIGKYTGAIWRVDPPITWACMGKDGKTVKYEFPFAFASQLLPIPPLADPLSVKHEEETPA